MAKALVKYETIDADQIKDIMDGKDPRPPADWDTTGDTPSDHDKKAPKSEAPGSIGDPASEH
jgi:cell division protease FtsH